MEDKYDNVNTPTNSLTYVPLTRRVCATKGNPKQTNSQQLISFPRPHFRVSKLKNYCPRVPPNFSHISQLQNSPIPAQHLLFFFSLIVFFFCFVLCGKLAIIYGKQRLATNAKILIKREYSVAIFLKKLLVISPYFDLLFLVC